MSVIERLSNDFHTGLHRARRSYIKDEIWTTDGTGPETQRQTEKLIIVKGSLLAYKSKSKLFIGNTPSQHEAAPVKNWLYLLLSDSVCVCQWVGVSYCESVSWPEKVFHWFESASLSQRVWVSEFWASEFWASEFWVSEFWVSEFWVSEFWVSVWEWINLTCFPSRLWLPQSLQYHVWLTDYQRSQRDTWQHEERGLRRGWTETCDQCTAGWYPEMANEEINGSGIFQQY